jgi:hypothetical protein
MSAVSFSSTDYPPQYPIQFHNEFSYASKWPMRLVFGCLQPADTGGSTDLADGRRVLRRLRPSTVDAFARLGVLYRRRFADHLGVPWQQAFGTTDRDEAANHCRRAGVEHRWDGEVLETRQRGDAVVAHPRTGEPTWFNHLLIFNVLGIEPPSIRVVMAAQDESTLASNSYFGDGTPIPPDVMEEVRAAYEHERRAVQWERGDILVVDNMLVAHARSSYGGGRRVLVAMGDPLERDALPLML